MAATISSLPAPRAPAEPEPAFEPIQREELVSYYRNLFPFNQLVQWLSYPAEVPPSKIKQEATESFSSAVISASASHYLARREFAIVLQPSGAAPGTEIFRRHLSFLDSGALRRAIIADHTVRFEVGAIHPRPPNLNRPASGKTAFLSASLPLERELVFDIDMDDYDRARSCCSGKQCCRRCFGYIACAGDILTTALREDFGFERTLWAYSGRRGAHLWVADRRARLLTPDARGAIVSYLNLASEGDDGHFRILGPRLPPTLRARAIIRRHFERVVLRDQNAFNHAKTLAFIESILSVALSRDVYARVRDEWNRIGTGPDSLERWAALERLVPGEACDTLMFAFCHPRLDVQVTRQTNHLLKSPFCVHPATGRICVALSTEELADFDPEAVPTIRSVERELNRSETADREPADEADFTTRNIHRTSLRRSLLTLEAFLQSLQPAAMPSE
ncbi:DNA primase, eukaryotic-type, small subunit [Fonticula alba]|uniref:DNA primase n=1 Tax=Fonticula alba TaxID=691883 RepID=A0A058Z560_FONAL|nr:DNA primase, eukaryotic-type, small subunit [Fonticula alba]KCV69053.1 DNA primase, eukaryotic-type, small subunit [Fonticula alba]|eukprot:XP_009496624.1 DNA primase, eukaryotic-type, small subunit [Fonticula alba]